MKKIYFEIQCSKRELVQKLKEKSYEQYFMSNGISVRINGEKFKAYSKKTMKHPLQRKFYGKIIDSNGKAAITGKFKYPSMGLICWLVMLIALIYGNINMLCKVSDVFTKIGAMAFFMCMYATMAFLLFSGRALFKKQEKDVLDFLSE